MPGSGFQPGRGESLRPPAQKRDDTLNDMVVVMGALFAAQKLLYSIVGHDDLQRDTLTGCRDRVEDAILEARCFVRQREQTAPDALRAGK